MTVMSYTGDDPRETSLPDPGKCACGSPRRPGQRTCLRCHASYQRRWREGSTQMQLTPAERELILALRAAGWSR